MREYRLAITSKTVKYHAYMDSMGRVAQTFPNVSVAAQDLYIGTDGTNSANTGVYGRNLVKYSGDIVSGTDTATLVSNVTLLYNQAGSVLLTTTSAAGNWGMPLAKLLHDGSALFAMQCTESGKEYTHLFRSPSGLTSVTGPAGANCAVLDIGTDGGTQHTSIRLLAQHSITEIYCNDGTWKVVVCEYNVRSSRTSGASNDVVRAWVSSDGGATFSSLLTFNTGGTHQTNHLHGAVQDPYTGYVYFMLGDTVAQRYLISWDGISAAPAANSSFATIGATAGWKITRDTELARLTTMRFTPTTIYSIPDCDDENTDTTSLAFNGVVYPKDLGYISTTGVIAGRAAKFPPLISCDLPNKSALLCTFRSANANASDLTLHLFFSGDHETWEKVDSLPTGVSDSSTSVPTAMFYDPSSACIIISGVYGKSIDFGDITSSGSSYLISAQEIEILKSSGRFISRLGSRL